MKRSVLALLFILASSSLFAYKPAIDLRATSHQEVQSWQFGKNDGMFFLLGPESTNKIIFTVDKSLSNSNTPDTLSVFCNASEYRLQAGENITCYGNFADVISIGVLVNDFINGSSGTYEYVPVVK